MTAHCEDCAAALVEIDHYGERLIGCVDCNVWRSNKRAFIVELSPEDIRALRELEFNGRLVRRDRQAGIDGVEQDKQDTKRHASDWSNEELLAIINQADRPE